METYSTIHLDRASNGIWTLTLNRPDKHNVINDVMIAELADATDVIEHDSSVRAVILTGSGKSFCAGGDLNWMKAQMTADRATKIEQSTKLAQMLAGLDELSVPLIGAINGSAYGGGIGMMSVCDATICSQDAKFVLSETKLGLIPATIGPYVVRRIGEAYARQYFFSSKFFDAQQAMAMNLASQLAPGDKVMDDAQHEAELYLQCKPGAVKSAKQLVRQLARQPDLDTLSHTAEALANRWETKEAKTTITQFLNR